MSEQTGASRESLFREAALNRMASPERLQLAARIVRPSSWLLLIAAAIAVAGAIWSSILIRVPVRVHGSGMLLTDPGPRIVAAAADVRIGKILVSAGDKVRTGQPLATFAGPAPPQAESEDHESLLSPIDGTIGEVAVAEGMAVSRGVTLMTLIPAAARAAPLVATVFLPPADGKRVRPGMAVTIQAASVKRGEYGAIVGRITHVAELPATAEGIAVMLRNQPLAKSLAANGATIEVEAVLQTDGSTPSGYRWTSSHGPNQKITMGTPCDADIIVETQRALTLLLPAARRFFEE